jgi:hypothetical protein
MMMTKKRNNKNKQIKHIEGDKTFTNDADLIAQQRDEIRKLIFSQDVHAQRLTVLSNTLHEANKIMEYQEKLINFYRKKDREEEESNDR